MIRVLGKIKSGLNIVQINAQSLKNKIDEFRYIFVNSNVDIIAVSETWFLPVFEDNMFSLDGYRILRSDRNSHGGGVALYVKNGMNCKIINKSQFGDPLEYILVELICSNKKMLVGVVYRPNKRISFDTFLNSFERIALYYTDIVISGDFNSNVLDDSTLVSSLMSLGIHIVNCTTPTHFTATAETLIDLVFTSSKEKILLYDQLSASVFSKHDLCFIIYDIPLNETNEIITFRDIKHISLPILSQDCISVDWQKIYYTESIDEQVEFLQNSIKYLYNKCVPLKRKKIMSTQSPWFDSEIKSLITKRDVAYSRWKRFRLPELHNIYKSARNEVTLKIRIKK